MPTVKQKIRKLYAKRVGQGKANAARIWKGFGSLGQQPYGWWLEPFGKNARAIGASWADVKERGL